MSVTYLKNVFQINRLKAFPRTSLLKNVIMRRQLSCQITVDLKRHTSLITNNNTMKY